MKKGVAMHEAPANAESGMGPGVSCLKPCLVYREVVSIF